MPTRRVTGSSGVKPGFWKLKSIAGKGNRRN
jgi:hypothetical protein